MPAPFGPMMPSTSPALSSKPMSRRTSRPPRSSETSLQEKIGPDASVRHQQIRVTTRATGAASISAVSSGQMILWAPSWTCTKSWPMPFFELGRLVAEAVVGEVERFLVLVVHVHHAADAAIGVLADPLAVGREILRVLGRFPGALQILDDVVAIAGVDEAHVAFELGEALDVFLAELLADLVAVDAQHGAPAEAFGGAATELPGTPAATGHIGDRPASLEPDRR